MEWLVSYTCPCCCCWWWWWWCCFRLLKGKFVLSQKENCLKVHIQGCIQKFQDSTCEVCSPWMLNSSITFKVLLFCTNTAVPAFLPCLEASLKVPFWNCVKYPLRFLLNLNGVECLTLHPKLQLGEEEKVTGGQIGWVWGMGDHFHVVLGQKLRNFKGPVSRGIVVVDNEVLVSPFLWPLVPHIFT